MSSIGENGSNIPLNPCPIILGPPISTESVKEKAPVTEALADKVETNVPPSIPAHLPNGSVGVAASAEPEPQRTMRIDGEPALQAPRTTWSAALEGKINGWLNKGKQLYAQAKEFGTRTLARLNAGLHEAGVFLNNLGKTLMGLARSKSPESAEATAPVPGAAATDVPDVATPDEIAKKNN